MPITYGDKKIKDVASYGIYYNNKRIVEVYYGSTLVYQYKPYAEGTILIYGSNTGLQSLSLSKGRYQCCIVGGGYVSGYWSAGSGAAVEIIFKLTTTTPVEVYSGGINVTAYLNINGSRVATANNADGQTGSANYSINTSSPYYESTVYASRGAGGGVQPSKSPYENWGAGRTAGGARLEYLSLS